MTDELKQEIIKSLKVQLPDVNEDRAKSVLSLIILEVESYNTCKKEIEWEKLKDVITEVLYQTMKIELDKSVASVKRGDMTIGYQSNSSMIQNLLADYKDLIKRVIGCGGVMFY